MDCTKRQRNIEEAYALKLQHRGPEVYFRGLIEISNKCRKNCLYCGIRAGNCAVERYEMSDAQVLQEAQFALDAGYGSIAIQGGERLDSAFIERITGLIYQIRRLQPGGEGKVAPSADPNNLGITLSLGEQSREVYREWMKAGASRYLLRIEASNKELYNKLHPQTHSYERRVQALLDLKSEGYLLGSGIMIGLPFQTYAHLDEDLQFLKNLEVDMVGMGPYIPHKDTPLGQIVEYWKGGAPVEPELVQLAALPRGDFWNFTQEQLLELSIDMVARLRILMPHINIAATTALQVLHPDGREMALLAGANVIMPNLSPADVRSKYAIYQGKASSGTEAAEHLKALEAELSEFGYTINYDKGDYNEHIESTIICCRTVYIAQRDSCRARLCCSAQRQSYSD